MSLMVGIEKTSFNWTRGKGQLKIQAGKMKTREIRLERRAEVGTSSMEVERVGKGTRGSRRQKGKSH